MMFICLPDLLRYSQRRYSLGLFDLIREPIRQAIDVNIGYAPETNYPHGLKSDFDASYFRELAGINFEDKDYYRNLSANYYNLNKSAIDYLFSNLPKNCILLTLEIPPWLVKECLQRDIDFIDFAFSPLRFSRDLYIAIRTSNHNFYKRLSKLSIPEEEIKLEASILAANIRMHQAHLKEINNFHFQTLENSLIFIGQSPNDASLISPNGCYLRISDFTEKLQKLGVGKNIIYKPHPYAGDFSVKEKEVLEGIFHKNIEYCHQNAYQLLSSHENFELVGISSGLLQESSWFGKKAHMLSQPFIPLTQSDKPKSNEYLQIHFHQMISPGFWHSFLDPRRPLPRINNLPFLTNNLARETIGLWWDYSKVMTWERGFIQEAFMRGGGANLYQRVAALEEQLNPSTNE